MATQVLITHPNRQYSHQTAIALQKHGLLGAYWTGVPAKPVFSNSLLRPVGQLLERHSLIEEVPNAKIRHCFWGPLARRVSLLFSKAKAVDIQHWGMALFDRWCASHIVETDANTVAASENAALKTFQQAKEKGWTTVLEAASFHHTWQDSFYDYPESDVVHTQINERKDAEIELADRVHTVSELARQSYLDAGVSPSKVVATTIGCDLSLFQPKKTSDKNDQHRPFTFIFAGHAGRRKGADTLLEACALLDDNGLDYRVWVAGATEPALSWDTSGSVERLGWLTHDQLTQRYRDADCFVLPSRHDSFGMVVVEAMACGTPALVSEQTGAKEAVTEDKSGWVIPADDPVSLAEKMKWCIQHADAVRSMRVNARKDAESYGWPAYYERVVKAYTSLGVETEAGS